MKRPLIAAIVVILCCALFLLAGLLEKRRWGLEGRYYANDSMAGEPAATRLAVMPELSDEQGSRITGVPVYSVVWKGWIAIPHSGTYQFATNSDDGSKLRIDGQLVVDNGGRHGLKKVKGEIALEQGLHELEIRYVQYGGFSVMQTFWTPPGTMEKRLPGYVLFSARPGGFTLWGRVLLRYVSYFSRMLLAVFAAAIVVQLVISNRTRLKLMGMALAKFACVPSTSNENPPLPVSLFQRLIPFSAGACLLLPFLTAIGVFWLNGFPQIFIDGDGALIEIAVRPTAQLKQLVGPYSRFGFNHPGPFYFHLLAPLYWLTGRNALSLNVTAMLINAASLAAIAVIIWRNTNRWAYAWFLFLIACYMKQTACMALSIWNPHIAIFPFLLAMLSFAMTAAGRFTFFPVAVIAASFATQTHLGFIPATAAMASGSFLLGWLHVWSGNATCSTAQAWKFVKIGMLFALLLWALPIVEECTHSPGNLSKIAAVFSENTEKRSVNETLNVASSVFSYFSIATVSPSFPLLPEDKTWRVACVAITIGQFGLLGVAFWLGRRRRHQAIAAIALSVVVLSLVMLMSIRSIIGQVHDYLVFWMTTIGLMAWLPYSEFLCYWGEQPSVHAWRRKIFEYGTLFGLIVITAFNCVDFAKCAKTQVRESGTYTPNFSEVTAKTLQAFQRNGITNCHIAIPDHEAWPTAAGLATQLDKVGIHVSIESAFAFQYPPGFQHRVSSQCILYVSSRKTGSKLEEKFPSEIEFIAKSGVAKVLLRRMK